jgi:hypothetical protein
VCSEIHKLIHCICNKEELPQQQKDAVIIPCDKTDCSNYEVISLLQTIYKILSGILVSRLSPSVDKIIGDCHCGF